MKSPAFQFYPEKWQADTRRLTWEAKGVYHELICVIWLQFQETCTIPDDDRFIAAEMGCNLDIWKKCKAELQDPKRPILETLRDGSLLVRGLLKEKEKQKHFKELAVRGGNASSRLRKGDSKWGKEMSVKKLQQRTEQRTEPLGKPNEPPTNSLSLSLSPTVEEIYYAYPLKVGKPAALKAIRRALESINPETLLSLTKKYAEHRNGDLTYIPHPSTWFNQERYNDDPRTWTPEIPKTGELTQPEIILLGKEYERVLDRMKTIKSKYADGVKWPENEATEFQTLKTRRDELRTKLGITI